jgi:hypothetical protein
MSSDTALNYPVIVRSGIKIDGFATETIPKNCTGTIIRKGFISSYEPAFEKICDNLLNLLVGRSESDFINTLIAVIKKDDTGLVYRHFPMQIGIRTKKEKKQYEVVFENELLDINKVEFVDDIFKLDIADEDKFVWLFRKNWKFGLFFDFTGGLKTNELAQELATHYKHLMFFNYYAAKQERDSFIELIKDGWFPFVQLLGSDFEQLIQHYRDDKKYDFQIKGILDNFDKDKVYAFSEQWWGNSIFNDKRGILEAGIEAYFQNSTSGYVNATKTLSTEIEGIIRVAYFREKGKNPSTADLKEYVQTCGSQKFSADSLGFPELFYEYMNHSIFQGFNLNSDEIPSSRHSYAHGVAKLENYNQIRAFQLILTLDQIYFFLKAQ